MTDFYDDLERELRRAHRRDTERHPISRVFDLRRRLPGIRVAGLPALVALAVVVALVAGLVAIPHESDVERPAAAPGKKVVTDVEDGIRWRLDGRVLTVQPLNRLDPEYEWVFGTRTSATCGVNVAAPPGDPRRETTVTRRWPAGQTSLSYRFPRDVSRWCRLEDQLGGIVAIVWFPGASPGAREQPPPPDKQRWRLSRSARETATNWARLFASSQSCPGYMGQPACERMRCQLADGSPIPNCTRPTPAYRRSFRDATVQEIAIKGDQATASFSNGETIELKRDGSGYWWIAGPLGYTAGRGFFGK